MEEMKPCPFCGHNSGSIESPSLSEFGKGKKKTYYPRCNNDDCICQNMIEDGEFGTVYVDYETEEEAIKAWNNRPIENYRDSMIYEDMLKVIELADRYGWNGVDNSKLLSRFFENLLKELEEEIEWAKSRDDQHPMGER